jgi:hypothetical protein
MSECQAQPGAWPDWGGFVDTHEQTGSKYPLQVKIAHKRKEETKTW